MKFKTFDLRAYYCKDETLLSFDIKGGRILRKRTLYIKKGNPFKMKISHEFAKNWKAKKQAERDLRTCYDKNLSDKLFIEVLRPVMKSGENKFRSGVATYWAGYARGIREHRQKSKETTLSAFDIMNADDVIELSHELGISEDKLMYAVLEVISKRKNGGKA